MAQAPNLKLAITAGIGSDHVDLNAASHFGLTVAEVTGVPVPFYLTSELTKSTMSCLSIATNHCADKLDSTSAPVSILTYHYGDKVNAPFACVCNSCAKVVPTLLSLATWITLNQPVNIQIRHSATTKRKVHVLRRLQHGQHRRAGRAVHFVSGAELPDRAQADRERRVEPGGGQQHRV